MHPLMNIAIKAARNASKNIIRATDRLDTIKVSTKKPNDFVTDIDKQVEQEITQVILDAYPDHAIWGEEGGRIGQGEYTWIIDPIDGTNNFIHGHPHFCISIAVQFNNIIEHGLIYDPLRQELFTASRGCGAYLNDRRIRVSGRKNFTGSTIASGIGNKPNKDIDTYINILAKILPQVAGTRRSGSAALDLAYTACGRFDGCFEMNLAPWDLAAGALLIKEAGGIVDDFAGNGDGSFLKTGNVIAGNSNIFALLLQAVNNKI